MARKKITSIGFGMGAVALAATLAYSFLDDGGTPEEPVPVTTDGGADAGWVWVPVGVQTQGLRARVPVPPDAGTPEDVVCVEAEALVSAQRLEQLRLPNPNGDMYRYAQVRAIVGADAGFDEYFPPMPEGFDVTPDTVDDCRSWEGEPFLLEVDLDGFRCVCGSSCRVAKSDAGPWHDGVPGNNTAGWQTQWPYVQMPTDGGTCPRRPCIEYWWPATPQECQ